MVSKSDIPGLEAQASQHLARKEYHQAARALQKIAKVKPTADVLATLGQVLLGLQQVEAARDTLRRALSLDKKRPAHLIHALGQAHFVLHEYRDAIACFTESHRLGLKDATMRYHTAYAYSTFDEFDKSLEVLRVASVEHPANYDVQKYFANELLLQGFTREAAEAARRAATLTPGTKDVRAIQSAICDALGDHAGNIPLLIEIAGEMLEDQSARGRLYDCLRSVHGDSMGQALSALRAAHPDNIALVLTAVRYSLEFGDFDEAERLVATAVALRPGNAEVAEAQARVALARGDADSAIAHFEEIWDIVDREFQETTPAQFPRRSKSPRIAPLVYMPIEIQSREFAARILTACFLTHEGFSSLLVASHTMAASITDLPRGIVLHKTMNLVDRLRIEQGLKNGKDHLIAAVDEEALAWTGPNWAHAANVDPCILPLVDVALLPGQRTADAYLSTFPEFKDIFRVTGNARIDLLSGDCDAIWQAEKEEIRKAYGDYVLVCTNFAGVNATNFSYRGACNNFLRMTNKPKDSIDRSAIVKMGKGAARSEGRYIMVLDQTLRELASLMPKTKFLLRAHPGESVSYWQRISAEMPNVTVLSADGSLQAWIRAAKAVIYMSGCTTGMEAFIAGANAIRFEIDATLVFPTYGVSAHISPAARNAAELKILLSELEHSATAEDAAKDFAFVSQHISMTAVPAARRTAVELAQLGRPHLDPARTVEDIENELARVIARGQIRRDRLAVYDPLQASKRISIGDNELTDMIERFAAIYNMPRVPNFTRLSPEAVLVKPPR